MGVAELLTTEKSEDLKIVSVKLGSELVDACRSIRIETGKTNTEVYTALLSEGLSSYKSATGKTRNGKRRGRPKGSKNKKKVAE